MQGRDRHLTRLVDASRDLYGSGPTRDALRARIRAALVAAGPGAEDSSLRVRIHPPDGGDGDQRPPGDHGLRIEVDFEAPRQPPGSPMRVRTHGGLRHRPGVKHLALGFQHDARRAARDAGFDDALLLAPDGRISEGTFWNVVFRDGDSVVWPDAPALPGVTQGLVGARLEKAGVPQRRAAVSVDSLAGLHAACALNSTGIADIAAIDGYAFPDSGAFAAFLRALLETVPWDPA